MADIDYYKTLGVSKTASADEIRKAYRKLARENHPDANKDNPAAVERFKEVQEAYDVLNDAEKRKQYDRFGSAFQQAGRGGAGANPFAGGGGFQGFGGAGPIDLGDLFGQGVDFSEFFGGGAAAGAGRRGKRGATRGEDVRATVRVPFVTAVNGGSVDVRIDRGESIETLAVKVPAGVNNGQVVRLAGQGNSGGRGGVSGDLLLQIEVDPHPYFRRDGSNLLVDVPITPSEAVLGCKVEVPTMNDGLVVLTIPPGTSSGVKLRLRGKGIVDPQTKQQGDQFVVVKIVVPKEMSDAEKSLYKKIAEHESSPRTGLWSG
jgi:DnaJ-class molecular chaperone